MTKHKKPKVGDTVGWAVYNTATGHISYDGNTRSEVRKAHSDFKKKYKHDLWKVARIVIDK